MIAAYGSSLKSGHLAINLRRINAPKGLPSNLWVYSQALNLFSDATWLTMEDGRRIIFKK